MTSERFPGALITLEGGEGCGKTTQVGFLSSYLTSLGYDVMTTREPGGTPLAEKIRDILLDPENSTLSPTAELLLYEAARAQHVAEQIEPAMRVGKIVLSDRFYDSTSAYQGAGRGLSGESLDRLHAIATGDLKPDMTIVLDLTPELGLARATKRGSDRIEREAIEFHERVRAGFLRIGREEPLRVKVIDATGSIEEVASAVREHVDVLLKNLAAR